MFSHVLFLSPLLVMCGGWCAGVIRAGNAVDYRGVPDAQWFYSSGQMLVVQLLAYFIGLSAIVASVVLTREETVDARIRRLAITLGGFVLISFPVTVLFLMTMLPRASSAIFWLALSVVAADTGAYFGGSFFGGVKLSLQVSPGKTVSGAIAGLLASVIVGIIAGYSLWGSSIPLTLLLCASIGIGVTSQIGDLLCSLLKRAVQIKDSGNLLPGHGGIIDRLAGHLFSAPIGLAIGLFVSMQ